LVSTRRAYRLPLSRDLRGRPPGPGRDLPGARQRDRGHCPRCRRRGRV